MLGSEQQNGENEKGSGCEKLKMKIRKFLELSSIQGIMFAITIYALLGDDLRLIFANKTNDLAFSNITIVVMSMFSVELVLSSFA